MMITRQKKNALAFGLIKFNRGRGTDFETTVSERSEHVRISCPFGTALWRTPHCCLMHYIFVLMRHYFCSWRSPKARSSRLTFRPIPSFQRCWHSADTFAPTSDGRPETSASAADVRPENFIPQLTSGRNRDHVCAGHGVRGSGLRESPLPRRQSRNRQSDISHPLSHHDGHIFRLLRFGHG